MPNIEVGPESLRAAAKGSQEVAGELRAANPRAIDSVKRAMPGSRAAGHADGVGDVWETKLKKLSTALDERADKLDAAAKLYDSGERDADEDFRRMKPRDPEAKWPR